MLKVFFVSLSDLEMLIDDKLKKLSAGEMQKLIFIMKNYDSAKTPTYGFGFSSKPFIFLKNY